MTWEYVNERLEYREDGTLWWKSGPRKGKEAGNAHVSGYIYVHVAGRNYRAHRLVWLLRYKAFPRGLLDHINHNKADNRIQNLRILSKALNAMSSPKHRGYCFHNGKWMAYTGVNGAQKHLGYYDTPQEARKAYLEHVKARFLADGQEPPAYCYDDRSHVFSHTLERV